MAVLYFALEMQGTAFCHFSNGRDQGRAEQRERQLPAGVIETAGLKSHSRQGACNPEEQTKMLRLTRRFPIPFYWLLGHQNGKNVSVTWQWEYRTLDV